IDLDYSVRPGRLSHRARTSGCFRRRRSGENVSGSLLDPHHGIAGILREEKQRDPPSGRARRLLEAGDRRFRDYVAKHCSMWPRIASSAHKSDSAFSAALVPGLMAERRPAHRGPFHNARGVCAVRRPGGPRRPDAPVAESGDRVRFDHIPADAHRLAIPGGARAAGEAREFAGKLLSEWALDADAAYDVLLIVSELVTNAVVYGVAPVCLWLWLAD